MIFSFETPIKYIEELDKEQDFLFVLAQHLDNKKYYNYVKNSRKYKILDNGAYELGESIPILKLKHLSKEINADVIILPDKLFDKKKSNELETNFLKLFSSSEKKKYKFMKVVCGNNLKEYLKSLIEVNSDANVSIIGLSQSRSIISPNLSFLLNYLKHKSDFIKPIHLLGLYHPYELIEARLYKEIVSIDTGLPINFTFKNKLFPTIQKYKEFKRISGEDIDTIKKLDINLAKKNIKILKKYYKK